MNLSEATEKQLNIKTISIGIAKEPSARLIIYKNELTFDIPDGMYAKIITTKLPIEIELYEKNKTNT